MSKNRIKRKIRKYGCHNNYSDDGMGINFMNYL